MRDVLYVCVLHSEGAKSQYCTVRVLKVSTSGYRLVACTCKSKQHVLIWVLQCYNSVLSNAGFIHVCLALFEGQVQW